jgi:hypothetical protein
MPSHDSVRTFPGSVEGALTRGWEEPPDVLDELAREAGPESCVVLSWDAFGAVRAKVVTVEPAPPSQVRAKTLSASSAPRDLSARAEARLLRAQLREAWETVEKTIRIVRDAGAELREAEGLDYDSLDDVDEALDDLGRKARRSLADLAIVEAREASP